LQVAGSESAVPEPAAALNEQPATSNLQPPRPYRRRLPDERQSITHKFSIAGHEGYIHVGLYEDGSPGEIFVTMSKEGSVISGLMDAFATSVSLALQYGVPLEVLVRKYSHMRFEPAGWTPNPDIPFAKSIMDYIFRWLGLRFLPREELPGEEPSLANGVKPHNLPQTVGGGVIQQINEAERQAHHVGSAELLQSVARLQEDAPLCSECGMIMIRAGACYRCDNCGATSGCG
jgi:ribonucleoside-diphosphate reductase alpha chain